MTSKLIHSFTVLTVFGLTLTAAFAAWEPIPETAKPKIIISTDAEPIPPGKFQPTWQSLEQNYQIPEWFRDAKFGIWAHWGPQCQPERGDWYARLMYDPSHRYYKYHVAHYGHPSKFGFKDVIHKWKAKKWDPDKLVALYKRAGAQYFFAMGNHHDNFDNWDSKYQPWNSVNVGPKKDVLAGWAAAAKKNGLPFGISFHASRAWTWYELSQGADKSGPKAGVPYDGKLTEADGKGKWWDGLDPQDLYAQNHTPIPDGNIPWDWRGSTPDKAYNEKFYNRTVDAINKYHPDAIYFDDTTLPLWPVSDVGLDIAAYFYNSNMQRHGGKLEAVLLGKILNESQRKAMVWDIERGVASNILPQPFQTDTCIGYWHYDRELYDRNGYKSAKAVIQMLADIVSKNGNLLLSIPVRGDGTLDDKEVAILEGITAWMDVNKESIFGTRPWKVFGEGPASEGATIKSQGFNEGKGKPFTAEDVRFTTKGDTLYAIVLGVPTKPLRIKSLGAAAKLLDKPIANVQLLGSDETIQWSLVEDALTIGPARSKPSDIAVVFRITTK
jgi:alpha-L-fucosidase